VEHSLVERARKNELGVLAVCSRGEVAGKFILLAPDVRPGWFQLYLELPTGPFDTSVERFSFDNYIDDSVYIISLLERWGAIEVQEPAATSIERRFFDVRAEFVR
jgi:hypothetical protein